MLDLVLKRYEAIAVFAFLVFIFYAFPVTIFENNVCASTVAHFKAYEIKDLCDNEKGDPFSGKPEPHYRMAIFDYYTSTTKAAILGSCEDGHTSDGGHCRTHDECGYPSNRCGNWNFTDHELTKTIPGGQGAYFMFSLLDEDPDASDLLGDHWFFLGSSQSASSWYWNNHDSPYYPDNYMDKVCDWNTEYQSDMDWEDNYQVRYQAWFTDTNAPSGNYNLKHTDDSISSTYYNNDGTMSFNWSYVSDPDTGISDYTATLVKKSPSGGNVYYNQSLGIKSSLTVCTSGCTLSHTPLHGQEYALTLRAYNGSYPTISNKTYFSSPEVKVYTDLVDPVSTITNPSATSWFNSGFNVSFSDSDDGAGLDENKCRMRVVSETTETKAWAWRSCTGSQYISVGVDPSYFCKHQGESMCKVYADSTDLARNPSATNTRSFNIDWTEDPISTLTVKTSSSGSNLSEGSWQPDNDPYFSWEVDSSSKIAPIDGYSYKLDSDPDCDKDISQNSFQYGSNAIADGQHTFRVRALDVAGNCGPIKTYFLYVDSHGDTISNLRAFTHSGGQFIQQRVWQNDISPYFNWNAPADSLSPVAGYSVSFNSDPDCTVDTGQANYSAPQLASGKYEFKVRAIDQAGNCGAISSYEIYVDTSADEILNITAYEDDTKSVEIFSHPDIWTQDNDPYFEWEIDTPEYSPISGYSVAFDEEPDCTVDTANTYYTVDDANPLEEGKHIFYLKAIDTAGNCGNTKAFGIQVDTVKEKILCLEFFEEKDGKFIPLSTWQKDNDPFLKFEKPYSSIEDPGFLTSSPMKEFLIDVDTDPGCERNSTNISVAPEGFQFNDDALSDGTHIVYIRAIDTAGNCGNAVRYDIWVDTSADQIRNLEVFDEPDGNSIADSIWQRDADPYLTWLPPLNPTSPIDGYAVGLDEEPECFATVANTNYQFTNESIPEGKHVIYIRTVDKAGNCSTSVAFNLYVDFTSEFTQNLVAYTEANGTYIPQKTWQNDSTPYFKWDAPLSASPVEGYAVGFDSTPSCDTITTTNTFFDTANSPLMDGQHTFSVISIDMAGNCSKPVMYELYVDTTSEIISNLNVYDSIGGTAIAESSWQKDDDPYLTWDAPSSASPIAGYTVNVDAEPACLTSHKVPHYTILPDSISDGKHIIYIRTRDEAGNCGNSFTFSIWVKTSAPGISFVEILPNPAKAGDTINIKVKSDSDLPKAPEVMINSYKKAIYNSVNNGVYSYTYGVTGSEVNTTNPTGKEVSITAEAIDMAGNPGTALSKIVFDFNIPVIVGDVSIVPVLATKNDELTITFEVSEELQKSPIVTLGSTYLATMNNKDALNYTFTYTLTGNETENTLPVDINLMDLAGNENNIIENTSTDFTAPVIHGLMPNNRFYVDRGEKLTISWSTTDKNKDTASIYLSLDSGQTFDTVLAKNINDSGSFEWQVTQSPTNKARFKVEATDKVGLKGSIESTADFRIRDQVADHIKLTTEDGKAVINTTEKITIQVVDALGDPVDGQYEVVLNLPDYSGINGSTLSQTSLKERKFTGTTKEDGSGSVDFWSSKVGIAIVIPSSDNLPSTAAHENASITFVECFKDADCPKGQECDQDVFRCFVPGGAKLCESCIDDEDCINEGSLCVQSETDQNDYFCGLDCSAPEVECPDDYKCAEIVDENTRVTARQCIPNDNLTCDDLVEPEDGDSDSEESEGHELEDSDMEFDESDLEHMEDDLDSTENESGELDTVDPDGDSDNSQLESDTDSGLTEQDKCKPGTLGCDCFENGTCEDGLVCHSSDICIQDTSKPDGDQVDSLHEMDGGFPDGDDPGGVTGNDDGNIGSDCNSLGGYHGSLIMLGLLAIAFYRRRKRII